MPQTINKVTNFVSRFFRKNIAGNRRNFEIFIITCFGFIFMILLTTHLRYVNGPDYWHWPYANKISVLNLFLFLLGSAPFLIAQLVYYKRKNITLAIVLLMIANLSLQIFCNLMQSPNHKFDWLVSIVQNHDYTTYYNVAQGITNIHEYLSKYAANVASYGGHIINKPAGIGLYYLFFQRLISDPASSALVGGLFVGIIAAFSVPCIYFLSKTLMKDNDQNTDVPFLAASFLSIIPSGVLFLPEFDQLYPIFTCLLIILWVKCLRIAKIRYSVLFALVLAFATFVNWNILVVGAFLLFYTIYMLVTGKFRKTGMLAVNILIVLAIYGFLYLVLYWISGYNVIDVFISNYIAQHKPNDNNYIFPYQQTLFFTLYDYLLGNGFISAIMVFFVLRNIIKKKDFISNYYFWLVIMLIAQLLVVSIGYFLPTETARLWLFLQPIITIAAVLFMKNLNLRQRGWIFTVLWLMTFTTTMQLRFF